MSDSTAISSQITSLQNSTAATQATETRSTELDQDAFLQLLMIQLKNQDPTDPMDTSEFMSQQAQYTQISELQKLNSSFSELETTLNDAVSALGTTLSENSLYTQASSLIGQNVIVSDSTAEDESGKLSGVIASAVFNDGKVQYNIISDQYPDGKLYDQSAITKIGYLTAEEAGVDTTTTTETAASTTETTSSDSSSTKSST